MSSNTKNARAIVDEAFAKSTINGGNVTLPLTLKAHLNDRVSALLDAKDAEAKGLREACEKAYAAIGAVGLKLQSEAPPWQEPLLAAFAELRAALKGTAHHG